MKKSMIVLVCMMLFASLLLLACGQQTTPATSTAPTTQSPTSPVVSTPASSTPVVAPSPVISTTPATGKQQYGGVLRIITSATPLILGDPVSITDFGSVMSVIPCLEALVNSDNAGQIHPVLATDWSIADDGKSITFHLRKGVKFHDGTDFNAAAAKWNLDRYMASGQAPQWTGIDVIDDYTIRLNVKSYQNTLLNALEASAGWMVSPTAAEKNGLDWIRLNPVGTGPFKFKNFVRDASLEYSRFDNYWDQGKPYLDGVQFLFIVDANTANIAFQAGAGDALRSPNETVSFELIQRGYKYEKRPGPLMSFIPDSKHTNSPFSNIKVRQAISYAIDRKSIAATLGKGMWEVANQPAAAWQFGHIDTDAYAYNPAKAKQLLAEAGYPNGFTTTIITSNTFAQEPLLAIQANLAAIGINAKLDVVANASWNEKVMKGWDNALIYVTQGVTQTNYASFLSLYFGASATRYPVLQKPAGLTDLIDKALAARDFETEKALCQQAVKMLVDDCTTIPLYIMSENYILQDYVHDTYFSNLGGSGFRWSPQTAWMEKVSK